MARISSHEWEDFLRNSPNSHILQTPAWGELKSKFGWTPDWLVEGDLGAQILFQKLPLGFQVAYIPRGPVSSSGPVIGHPDWEPFLEGLDVYCRERQVVFLKIEPDFWERDVTKGAAPVPGCRLSSHSIQPPRTIEISLVGSEEEILSRMKSKTRYNIRLAMKKGVSVREITSVEAFYDLLQRTSDRAEFGIHTHEYYQEAFQIFHPRMACALFLAEYEGIPLASIMVFQRGERSWYFYGASSNEYRQLMPTYLIQWEAMRWAKKRGSETYDLWGVPDQDQETLEGAFMDRNDGLWGVYRFKRGFGGQVRRASGPWDRVYKPALYSFYMIRNRIRGGE